MNKTNLNLIYLFIILVFGWNIALTAQKGDPKIFQAQQKMKTLAYYNGPQDSLLNEATTAALKKFQQDNGLTVNGQLDVQTKSLIDAKRRLRNKAQSTSHAQIIQIVKKHGFSHPFDLSSKQLSPKVKGSFKHLYKLQTLNGEKVIVDNVTDLMWQHGGSADMMMWDDVKMYVADANKKKCAGFSDWRLPIVEELASLLENMHSTLNMYIDAKFNATQTWCWTADNVASDPKQSVWIINFDEGQIDQNNIYVDSFVRLVRSIR